MMNMGYSAHSGQDKWFGPTDERSHDLDRLPPVLQRTTDELTAVFLATCTQSPERHPR